MESPPMKRTLTQLWSESTEAMDEGSELISMLPDELVVRVFSFTDVFTKLRLEQVCRRFKRCVDTPEAWGAAIHVSTIKNATDTVERFLINGTEVHLSKRTPTLMYLLERITPQLLQLQTSESDTAWTLLTALATYRVIYPQDRVRLSRFKFDCPEDAISPVVCLLSHFNNSLESIDVNFRPIDNFQSRWKRANLAEFWTATASCSRLSDLSFCAGTDEESDGDQMAAALTNKPLLSLSLYGVRQFTNEHLVSVCNGAYGRALERLRLEGCDNLSMTVWTPWQMQTAARAALTSIRLDLQTTREFLLEFGQYFPNIARCSFGRPLLSLTEDTNERPSAVETAKRLLNAYQYQIFQAELRVDRPGELFFKLVGPAGDAPRPSDLCDWVSFSENRCRLGRGLAQVDLHWS